MELLLLMMMISPYILWAIGATAQYDGASDAQMKYGAPCVYNPISSLNTPLLPPNGCQIHVVQN